MGSLCQRINRRLADQDELLRPARGGLLRPEVGHFYIVSTRRNAMVNDHVDPVELGREVGALQPWEELVQ
jgi:hypothetical protein